MRNGTYSNVMARFLTNNELLPTATAPVISCNGVAAIAHDRKNKRLYYTPMLLDRLAYIDLRTMKNHIVTNHFTGLMPKSSDQSNIITRMVIADDDKGYALTNDANHLIRFKTGNNAAITDLGLLVDAPGNKENSIHNVCSSYGGDLIAADDNKLYLVTFGKLVFKINIHNKVAKYLGTITGIPATYHISGAAVDKKRDNVIIVSHVDASAVYSLNLETLVANPLPASNPWIAADLASSHILKDKNRREYNDRTIVFEENVNNDHVQLYPNPVTTKQFKLNFTNVSSGSYMIRVLDVNGKSILSKSITINVKANSTSVVDLPEVITSGIYIVRITDVNSKVWYSGKIFVQ
jgi:hypothetical protein